MVCEHLRQLEEELMAGGAKVTYRGSPWTENCREWVYFDTVLDTRSISSRMCLSPCVRVHENLDPKSGSERGFYCEKCGDGVMGRVG